jgi:hypothetical protein
LQIKRKGRSVMPAIGDKESLTFFIDLLFLMLLMILWK